MPDEAVPNVVDIFDRKPVVPAGEPVPDVVRQLEKHLEQARAGDITDFAIAMISPNGRYQTNWAGEGYVLPLLGAVAMLDHDLKTAKTIVEQT